LKAIINKFRIFLKLKHKKKVFLSPKQNAKVYFFTLIICTKSSSDKVSSIVSTVCIAIDFFNPVIEPLASIKIITSRGDDVARIYQFCTRQSNKSNSSVSSSGYSHL
jgi:hypothetical protein